MKAEPTKAKGNTKIAFLRSADVPPAVVGSGEIPRTDIPWAATGDFADIAHDHCAAVAVTNLALYFAGCGHSELMAGSVRDTFVAVHGIVGNGPVATIARKARRYFESRGRVLRYRPAQNFGAVRAAIGRGHPCGILLCGGIAEWHWALAVGYRDCGPGGRYVCVVDGWDRDSERFFRVRTFARPFWVAATEYWLG